MRATILLRVASVVVGVQGVLHTIGGVFGAPPPGAGATAMLAMRANHFTVMGLDRSYYLFYIGFGLAITVSLLVESALFWMLAGMVRRTGLLLRPILWLYVLSYVAVTVLAAVFFFPPPLIFDAGVVILLAWAAMGLKPVEAAVAVA
jgi:hypothetical protein